MKWAAVFLVVLFGPVLLLAPLIGFLVQPFAPWWIGQTDKPAVVSIGNPSAGPVAPVPTVTGPELPISTIRLVDGVNFALTWLNPKVPYLWGGCSRRGIDCSCFVQTVLASIGIAAPRVTTDQMRWTRPVSRDQLQALDLVYFDNTCTSCGGNPTHVGLYLGGGKMIDAGDPVQIESMDTPYWRAHYDSAGRPPGL